jgi:hypothetical protein
MNIRGKHQRGQNYLPNCMGEPRGSKVVGREIQRGAAFEHQRQITKFAV